jgi:hypothetical protein
MNNYGELNYEISPEGQKSFLTDLANTVYQNGGSGILYWEPCWISSEMCDKWGQGSSYENVSFFDFTNNNEALPAIEIFSYCRTLSVESNTIPGDFFIFPNPGTGIFTIKGYEKIKEIRVSDSRGLLVKVAKTENGSLNISDLPDGVYFLTIIFEEENRPATILKY